MTHVNGFPAVRTTTVDRWTVSAEFSSLHGGFGMNRIFLAVTLAAAQLFAVSAFAQSKGEADPAQSKAIPSKPATAEEKAAAKSARKTESMKQAKTEKAQDQEHKTLGKAKVATKAERKEAAKTRRASAAASLKKGEISSGEK
ncbi:hypothetical protein [Ramlibacter sp.]|uniref:hypothetical protein n=1 Tax=Ramlibacter sp. TaxID=1917967 RepID=UPI002C9083F7|nr:hypothetical protein [Ramlibacter sp.]HWI83050.1 hypothetical protein [Ramlibacter sp.]